MAQLITRRSVFLLLFFALIVVFIPVSAAADDRTENIDVFLVVDKSLSMEEELSAVRNYISTSIIDELLIPGDNLVLIVFYGSAELLFSGKATADKSDIRGIVQEIRADGRFTDIGNALDTLRSTIPDSKSEDRRKYLLLITDGIQEAPPESAYYTPDGSFNHEFLANTKEILMEGWKIHILGIGSATAAKEVADALSGTYTEVSETPTEEEMADKTKEFLGTVERIGNITIKTIDAKGMSRLGMELQSVGYSEPRTLSIRGVSLEMPDGSERAILAEPSTITIEPGESMKVILQLQIEDLPSPGVYSGDLIFSFAGDTSFSPAGSRVEYRVGGFAANNLPWLIPAGAVILIGLILVGIFIPRLLGGGSAVFLSIVDDGIVRKRQYKLKYSEKLYLVEGMMGLSILETPGAKPAGEISADSMGLHLSILDEKNYSSRVPIPTNVLGEEIIIVKKYGKKAKITFQTP